MVFGSLTAMRGIAALLVAFSHPRYGVIGVPLFDLYIFKFRFGNRGYLWVDFFFILSVLFWLIAMETRTANWICAATDTSSGKESLASTNYGPRHLTTDN